MKIFTLRSFLLTAMFGFLCCCSGLHAQPAGGKWFTGEAVPGLSQTGRVLFVDSLLGYFIGHDTGYVTTSGGMSWKQLTFPPEATPAPSFLFAPSHDVIISFQQRRSDQVPVPGVIKSTNQGATWSVVSADPLPSVVKALTMWTENDGFRIWLDDSYKTYCAVTHDGGKTYTDTRGDATLQKYLSKIAPPTSLNLQSNWSDSLHGAISVYSNSKKAYPVLLTSDGGRTWKEHTLKFNGDSTVQHSYVSLSPKSNTVWAVPAVPNSAQYYFYSSDFGTTWNNSMPFAKNTFNVGNKTKPSVIQIAPVSETESWVIIASDSDHPDLSRLATAYNDISGKWVISNVLLPGNGFYWYMNDIQFTDPTHGWVTAEKRNVVNNTLVILDSLFFFRFATGPVNAVKDDAHSGLSLMPNPASSSVRISGLQPDEIVKNIEVTDPLGRANSTITKNTGAEIEFDISHLANGRYIVSINTSARKESIPVMVVH